MIPFRASAEDQIQGLDVSECGLEAYPEFKRAIWFITISIVIPAKAGIQLLLNLGMDPRIKSEDDETLNTFVTLFYYSSMGLLAS